MMKNQGTKNPMSKITKEKVELIHAIKMVKKVKNEIIGNLFGIKKSTISGILNRKSWAHVEPPTYEQAIKLIIAFYNIKNRDNAYNKLDFYVGKQTMRDFIKSKKSKGTLWLMRPFSDNQGINNFRYSMGVKK